VLLLQMARAEDVEDLGDLNGAARGRGQPGAARG
jgi:hypothetical protein